MSHTHYKWKDLPSDQPMEKLTRRRITGQRMMLSHVALDAGCRVPSHAHENEQMAVVLRGSLRFDLGPVDDPGSESIVVGAGEVLHLSSMQPHAATALEDSLVLDLFSPASETTGVDPVAEG